MRGSIGMGRNTADRWDQLAKEMVTEFSTIKNVANSLLLETGG